MLPHCRYWGGSPGGIETERALRMVLLGLGWNIICGQMRPPPGPLTAVAIMMVTARIHYRQPTLISLSGVDAKLVSFKMTQRCK